MAARRRCVHRVPSAGHRLSEAHPPVDTSTPEQLGSLVKSELERWKNVVARAKLTAD